ncbi:hypothetical protein Ms3S1_28720 [Methylosinus sp. 3S-1]|uniref:Uncharacterized protein n=1 Tax=Methylosinus trichosporium (strain ATCC 35070 / NCIMB 11131 / UNIQEM 75 / OB3b) TaxID=595536 RepID=A0A2D2D1W1_METT3|nr:hypothetical protein CQW49_14590 [Methylosinus trichosporium OB3b]
MTTAQAKIVLNQSQDIPFNKLTLSQANVRKVKAGVSVEELAEDISRRGLLQSRKHSPWAAGPSRQRSRGNFISLWILMSSTRFSMPKSVNARISRSPRP